MSTGLKDILERTSELESVSIEEALKITCKSIELHHKSNSGILKAQMKRLNFIMNLIEKNYIFTQRPDEIIREINSIIKSLMAYECLIDNKLDAIERIYREVI
ncbi:MAG: hypothetical protein ACRCTZ_18035 [Sarcina sp.]